MSYHDENYTRENLQKYRESVKMPGGWNWNIVDTLKRIDLYWNSKFESGAFDNTKRRKFFYNICKPACDIATKFIDLDTKHLLLYSERSGDDFKVWLMRRDLQNWMEKNHFGQLINDLADALPKFGHVVVKKNKEEHWKRTHIANLRMDPSADCLEESGFVYELLDMTRRQIKEMKWNNKEAVEELFSSHPHQINFRIYECYDYNFGDGKKWVRTFRADFLNKKTKEGVIETTESELSSEDEYGPGLVLHEDEFDELPYREMKWTKVEGRWLGLGIVEDLFDNQIRQNELSNTKARAMELSAMHIYQTQDELVGRNVLTDVENGDIIVSPSGIQPVATENRDLASWNFEEARWDTNTERKTFTFDITRGEELPSGTPLGVAKISANQVETYYNFKRENFGLFLVRMIMEDVLPSFKKQNTKEHIMRFFGNDEEIERLRQAIIDYQMNKATWNYAVRTGTIPSPNAIQMERARIEGGLKKKKDLELLIPDGFYEDTVVNMKATMTGEEIDVANTMQTLMQALQMAATNPMLLKDKVMRRAFFKILELAGVSPIEIGFLQSAADEQQQQQPIQQTLPPGPPQKGSAMPKLPPRPVQPVGGETNVKV